MEPEKWTEPLDASEEGPGCCSANYYLNVIEGSLDSMHINVYTTEIQPKKLRPVMVFIHGGGFVSESSSSVLYSPEFLLQKDIVFVSFNYRLTVFGEKV